MCMLQCGLHLRSWQVLHVGPSREPQLQSMVCALRAGNCSMFAHSCFVVLVCLASPAGQLCSASKNTLCPNGMSIYADPATSRNSSLVGCRLVVPGGLVCVRTVHMLPGAVLRSDDRSVRALPRRYSWSLVAVLARTARSLFLPRRRLLQLDADGVPARQVEQRTGALRVL